MPLLASEPFLSPPDSRRSRSGEGSPTGSCPPASGLAVNNRTHARPYLYRCGMEKHRMGRRTSREGRWGGCVWTVWASRRSRDPRHRTGAVCLLSWWSPRRCLRKKKEEGWLGCGVREREACASGDWVVAWWICVS
jgi:hypothetical protein